MPSLIILVVSVDVKHHVYFPSLLLFLRMYLWWSLCTLHLFARQVSVTLDDSGLCVRVAVVDTSGGRLFNGRSFDGQEAG